MEEGDPDERIAKASGWNESVGVGAAQALALIPGFSRSGATMGGGLLVGLSNQDAARFAFLLRHADHRRGGRPEAARSSSARDGDGVRGQTLVGALCSAATAYIAVRFLMRFFHTNTLVPFAIYCFAAGAAHVDLLFGRSNSSH